MKPCFSLKEGDISLSSRTAEYNTRQREAVLSYLASRMDLYVTASQIVSFFALQSVSIGRTTVYRHLEKLVRSGAIRKYSFDGAVGACYKYVSESERESERYHLKCEKCGGVFDLSCNVVSDIARHIFERHDFQVNDMKTVFYGKCKDCL